MARVKASSIYESVISIAIISITITVATSIFVNIMSSQDSIAYYQMIEKVSQLKTTCTTKQYFKSKNFDFKSYKINQVITNYDNNKNLKLVTYNVTSNKKKIKTFKYLIRKK